MRASPGNGVLVRPLMSCVPPRILEIIWCILPPELADIVHHPLVESAIDYHRIKCSSGGDLEESLVRIRHESGVKVIGTEESFLR